MDIRYIYETEKECDKEKALNEANLGLQEAINRARINKNVQKWLNNKEITNVKVRIWNSIYIADDYRIDYYFNDEVVGYGRFCSGNKLDYFKISFCKKRI